MDTLFKFGTDRMGLEVEGGEEFVRRQIEAFLPSLSGPRSGEAGEGETDAEGRPTLRAWYRRMLPPGQHPTMQDHILIFAYYLHKVKRQFVFTPDDMKLAFREVGGEVPKSLLQIMGSLKRDHNLLWPGDKRGEYCLLPSGIQRVESLLGIRREPPPKPPAPPEPEAAAAPVPPSGEDSEARSRFEQMFREGAEEGGEAP